MRDWNVPFVVPESHVKGRGNGTEYGEIDKNTCLNAPFGECLDRQVGAASADGPVGGGCDGEYTIDVCRSKSRPGAEHPTVWLLRRHVSQQRTVWGRQGHSGRQSTTTSRHSQKCDCGSINGCRATPDVPEPSARFTRYSSIC